MPFFTPHERDDQLPVVGDSIERAVMDWKAVADKHEFSKAKDVAAFANHLGGTLLIGAKERSPNGHPEGQLEGFRWHTDVEAGEVRDAFSKAVKDRCVPTPLYDFAELKNPDNPGERVVAVNVWPSLLLIAVKVFALKPTEGYGGEAYVYPVRAGTDAKYLTPSEIPMYMTPHVRRVSVLLSRIPSNQLVTIATQTGGQATHQYNARIGEIIEDQNIVWLNSADNDQRMHSVPLDCIVSVHETWDTAQKRAYWRMYVQYSR